MVGRHGAVQVALLSEKTAEVEGAVGIPAFVQAARGSKLILSLRLLRLGQDGHTISRSGFLDDAINHHRAPVPRHPRRRKGRADD